MEQLITSHTSTVRHRNRYVKNTTHLLEKLVTLRPAPRLDARRVHRELLRARPFVRKERAAAQTLLLRRAVSIPRGRDADRGLTEHVLLVQTRDVHEAHRVLGELGTDVRLRVVRGDRAQDLRRGTGAVVEDNDSDGEREMGARHERKTERHARRR